MARVVQRRSNPPYLLVVVVFLFLVSATLAVMRHMDAEKAGGENEKLQDQVSSLASSREMQSGNTQQRISVYEQAKAKGDVAQTVMTQLSNEIALLTKTMTGMETEATQAIRQADALYDEGEGQIGLITKVRELKRSLADEIAKVAARDQLVSQAGSKLGAMNGEFQTLKGSTTATITTLKDEIKAALDQLQTEQTKHLDLRGKAEEEATARIDEQKKQVAKLNGDIQKQQLDVQRLRTVITQKDARIKELEGLIGDVNPDGEGAVVVTPDGKVMDDPTLSDVCYIDLGQKDGIKAGFTFSVYSPENIAKGEKKGSLLVLRVLPDISQCRVTVNDKKSPIAKDDLVDNLAFNASRTYTFVVEGEFDIYGRGGVSSASAEDVKTLIRLYGGKITDEVGVKTDYVVLGQPLSKPMRPSPDAAPQVLAVYRKNLEAWSRYKEVQSKAVDLHVPVLNTNRFLDYIGLMPTKTLRYE